MRWLDPISSFMRLVAITQFMLIWQVVELNTFFIKHIFPMPAEHPICVTRILMTGLIAAPTIRQYYTYVTDPQCKRLGTQCWVFFMITFSELILVIKHGLDLFSHTQLSMMGLWLVLIMVVSCAGVGCSHWIYRWRHQTPALPDTDTICDPVSVSAPGPSTPRVLRTPTKKGGGGARKRAVKLPP